MREFIKWLCTVVVLLGVQGVRAESTQLDIECQWGKISATLAVPESGSDTVVIIVAGSLKSLLMKVKEESEKASLKLINQKMKIMASGPIRSDQIRSVAQSCPTLCDPMNHSMPGLPVHHQLLEFTQTHVHRVSDAIQPSHPLLSPSPPAPSPSQHQSLFQ